MGYTHYWRRPKRIPFAKWDAFIRDAKKIVETNIIPLVFEYDEPERGPEVGPNRVRFNGVGEDGHETFLLDWDENDFAYCKTANKPYDLIVCALLIAASYHFGKLIEISSDGEAADWETAVVFTQEVLGYSKLPFKAA